LHAKLTTMPVRLLRHTRAASLISLTRFMSRARLMKPVTLTELWWLMKLIRLSRLCGLTRLPRLGWAIFLAGGSL
jgi:hypothetical protein